MITKAPSHGDRFAIGRLTITPRLREPCYLVTEDPDGVGIARLAAAVYESALRDARVLDLLERPRYGRPMAPSALARLKTLRNERHATEYFLDGDGGIWGHVLGGRTPREWEALVERREAWDERCWRRKLAAEREEEPALPPDWMFEPEW